MATCTRLDTVQDTDVPQAEGCEECLKIDGSDWSWCFVDETGFRLS